jgi:hypothetical protein
MKWQLAAYLVKLSRFGMLLALSLWVGAAFAMFLSTPVLFKRLARPEAGEIAGAMLRRVDWLLVVCIVLVVVGLGFRIVRDGTAPPASLAGPIAAMVASRLVSAFAVAPAIRALRPRLRDANAPATDAERAAFGRLHGASMTLMTLEIVLGVWTLFAIS